MNETTSNRKITLTFDGEAAAGGRVPLTVLAGKLQALQSLLFHAAATVVHDSAARRGQWANRYRDAVELRFTDAREGSLTIEAELAEPAPGLFGERDLGLEAVDLTYDVAAALSQSDYSALAQRVADRQERMLLLRQFEDLAPREGEAFRLTLANGAGEHPAIHLTSETRLRTQTLLFRDMAAEAGNLEPERIVGTLTKIHYGVSPEKLSVKIPPGREVDCFYDASLRDQVANLCAGSTVEVGGFGTRTPSGRLKQIDVVTDLDAVSMEPIRVARLEHDGRVYRFREPVAFNIEFTDGVWAYSNESLGVRGFALRRDEAFRELNEAFDYAFTEFALEDDAALDPKAIELKQRLLKAVEQTPSKGGD